MALPTFESKRHSQRPEPDERSIRHSEPRRTLACAFAPLILAACSTHGADPTVSSRGNVVVKDAGADTRDAATGAARDAGGIPMLEDGEIPTAVCGDLHATVRDFTPMHPDFESKKFTPAGEAAARKPVTGLVEDMLGEDSLPVFLSTGTSRPALTSKERFDEWYRDVPGVNMRFEVDLPLSQSEDGNWVYDSAAFFPIDGLGFGNFGGYRHNYHFTTEIHVKFKYQPGQTFTFRGDDDLWLFIGGRLALDLGGTHLPVEGTVVMDDMAAQLGFQAGDEVAMDIFQAERHTDQSNFHVETNIDCLIGGLF